MQCGHGKVLENFYLIDDLPGQALPKSLGVPINIVKEEK